MNTPAPGERPFVAINCSAIPRDLMESEIFGHVRGAFTGATADRPGAAELAHGGTLFLDEIAEMDLGLQAKLLRFLQSGAVRRVGGSEEKKVEVRVVCATNRDPQDEVHAGRFRTDLFYRLHVLPIHLPPLRERREDILPIADHVSRPVRGGRRQALPRDSTRPSRRVWRAIHGRAMCGSCRISCGESSSCTTATSVNEAMLPAATLRDERPDGPAIPHRIVPFHEQERQIIEAALAAFGGNIARAAAALELSPSTIYRKREAWVRRC